MDSDSLMKQNQSIAKERLIQQLEDMPIIEIACRRAGIGRATYYRWIKLDADFASKCREALDISTTAVSDIAEAKLINAIQEGNMSAISFWLRHHHSTYANRLNVSGTIRHEAATLTPEQEALVSRALRISGLMENNHAE